MQHRQLTEVSDFGADLDKDGPSNFVEVSFVHADGNLFLSVVIDELSAQLLRSVARYEERCHG